MGPHNRCGANWPLAIANFSAAIEPALCVKIGQWLIKQNTFGWRTKAYHWQPRWLCPPDNSRGFRAATACSFNMAMPLSVASFMSSLAPIGKVPEGSGYSQSPSISDKAHSSETHRMSAHEACVHSPLCHQSQNLSAGAWFPDRQDAQTKLICHTALRQEWQKIRLSLMAASNAVKHFQRPPTGLSNVFRSSVCISGVCPQGKIAKRSKASGGALGSHQHEGAPMKSKLLLNCRVFKIGSVWPGSAFKIVRACVCNSHQSPWFRECDSQPGLSWTFKRNTFQPLRANTHWMSHQITTLLSSPCHLFSCENEMPTCVAVSHGRRQKRKCVNVKMS